MAEVKITALPAYSDPVSTDVLPIVDVTADLTKKVSITDLLKNAAAGTAAAPAFAFDADPDTGIYRAGANQLALATNGTGRLFIDSSGNVGIGTTSPTNASLVIEKVGFQVSCETGTSGDGQLRIGHFANGAFIGTYGDDGGAADFIRFGTHSGDERLRITSDGKVGVGDSAPLGQLSIRNVSGTTGFYITRGTSTSFGDTPSLRILCDSSGPRMYGYGNGLKFYTAAVDGTATQKAVITSDGKVGVGTSSPTGFIHIQGTSTGTETYGRFTTGSAPGDQSLVIKSGSSRDHMAIQVSTNAGAADDLVFQPDGGNVGIGTASPADKLHVVGNGRFNDGTNGVIQLGSSSNNRIAGGSSYGGVRYYTSGGHSWYDSSSELMKIDSSGRLLVGTSTSQAHASANLVEIGNYTLTNAGITINSPTSGAGLINFGDSASSNRRGRIEYTHAGDAFRFYTADSERVRIDSSGRLLVGASSSRSQQGIQSLAQVEHTDYSGLSLVVNNTNDNTCPVILMGKSKGSTKGSSTVVSTNSRLGVISFQGADGTDIESAAATIECRVDGNPGANDMPGRLEFRTTADGATSSTERMRIDSSGRVGIGTTSPGNPLAISQTVSTTFGNAGTYLGLGETENTSGQKVLIGFGYKAAASNEYPAVIGYTATSNAGNQNGAIVFGTRSVTTNTAPTERVRIDSSGRLLVGTSSARGGFDNNSGVSANLQVETAGTAAGGTRAALAVINNGSADADSAGLYLARSGGTAVGSFTAVTADDTLARITFSGADGTEFVPGASIEAVVDSTPGANDMPGRLVFSTTADGESSPTERMRIDSSGRFYFGTTNTDPTFNRVNGIHITANEQVLCRTSTANGWDLGSNSSTPTHLTFFTDNGSARVTAGNISSNGSTTTYATSSDYRLKENIIKITGASDRLQMLRPVLFDWKDGFGGTQSQGEGFIAHELQEVCPLAVQGEKDAVDDNGNPKYQGIDQSKLVPLLTAALQEALAKIETLEARLSALEAS
jgi:hypothetical protein